MLELCLVAKTFNKRPSDIIGGMSGYCAYCFDVAAAIYISNIENGRELKGDGVDALTFL
jgi:hypothetical protein